MEKDLIIGAFTNYTDYDVLKPWVQSIKDTGFDGDIVLSAIDATDTIVQKLESEGVKVIRAGNPQKMMVHMLRFLSIYDYLKSNKNKYRFVVTTDVRDVIFQSNPIDFIKTKFYNIGLIAASEAIKIKDEKWNRENIIKNFGQYFYNDVSEREVLNVGLIAGKAELVKDLCFTLFQMSSNRPDWVADQAAYNMILSFEPWKTKCAILKLRDAWALNAHVTNKPDQMEEFGPYLLEDRPYMNENGKVVNSEGKPFVIVHQYDRIPQWMEYFSKKYGIKITKDTNTGTSPKYFLYKS
jgi:hypothetical protein